MFQTNFSQQNYNQNPNLIHTIPNNYSPIPFNYSYNQQIIEPLNSQNIAPSFNNPNIILPQVQQTETTLVKTNTYVQPKGSRLPLEKNHGYIPTGEISNNDPNEKQEGNPTKEEKKPLIIVGNHYEISKYAEILNNILKNIGIDEDQITNIIENTNSKERQSIKKFYNQKYNENLISKFQKELNGDFKELVIGCFMSPIEYDVYCLHNSIKGLGIKEGVLSEIIGSRTTSELQAIRKFYMVKYGETLKSDVAGETYGDYQKLLLALLQCKRSTSSQPNTSSCANDASDLYQLGEKKRENDEETYIRIFTKSSPTEIAIINHFYKQQTGKGLLGAIDSEFEFSGDTKNLLDTIVRAQVDRYGFYAKKLHDSMDNVGINNLKLIRNVCARYTVDLPLIKQAYLRDYGNDLLEDIENKIEGKIGKIIYSLILKTK